MGQPYSHVARALEFDPFDGFAYLREHCPVHHEADHDPPFFVVSRHADIEPMLRHPHQWRNGDGPGVFFQDKGVLGSADDPDHARHRSVVRRALAPTVIARLEPRIGAIADDLLDRIVPRGEGDFVDLYAFPFPALVIAELMGVDPEDRDDYRRWSVAVIEALAGGDLGAYAEATRAIWDDVNRRMDERQAVLDAADLPAGADPIGTILPEDLLSVMLLARREGTLSRSEAQHLAHQLLVAGHETTTSLIGWMLYRLIQRPDLMSQLRTDPARLDMAIEEALRFDSPVQGLFRTNREPVELHGQLIPARSKVQVLYAGANRDPERWEHPDEFRLDRDENDLRGHLAFGWGIHYCIGAPLARLETRLTFERVLARMGDIELAGEPRRNQSFVVRGLTSLPLRWTPVDPQR